MAKRLRKTLLDYLVIAISPAIIMVLIDSLVLFLVEVFYRGGYQGRLDYVLTLFVIGAVLIGRISIEEGRERAMLFAAPLGIAILLAIARFVQFQGALAPFSFLINCGLIALIWFSADKLTWDCTLIDEQEEDSGEGLLETIGLDRPDHAAMQREILPVPEPETEATTSREDVPTSWWGRFIERRRRPHAPGVWVVYFSLAALPLFGLGQLFLPSGDEHGSRAYAFELLFCYTASGLALLLSTSFLGLRRYLRQRRQEMPLLMVNLWLGIGVALIFGVMLSALLLPRPNAELAISDLPIRVGSPDQNASPYGAGSNGVEDEQQDGRLEGRDDADKDAPQSDQPGKNPAAEGKKSSETGQEASKGDSSNDKGVTTKAEGKGSDNGQKQEKQETKQPAKKEVEKQPNRLTNTGTEDKTKRPSDETSREKHKPAGGSGSAERQSPEKPRGSQGSGRRSTDAPPSSHLPRFSLPHGTSALTAMFKWLLYAVLAAIVIYAIWKNRAELLAALRDLRQSLADLWHRLFGGKTREAEQAAAEEMARAKPQRRFADFTDPFATGTAGRYPPEELVRYTFEALEAWARDAGHSRLPDQTPHEFARGLAADVSSMADDTRLLADLYCQVAYAPGTLQSVMVTRLPRLWQEMRAAIQPSS
jgi:hypothetical protein